MYFLSNVTSIRFLLKAVFWSQAQSIRISSFQRFLFGFECLLLLIFVKYMIHFFRFLVTFPIFFSLSTNKFFTLLYPIFFFLFISSSLLKRCYLVLLKFRHSEPSLNITCPFNTVL